VICAKCGTNMSVLADECPSCGAPVDFGSERESPAVDEHRRRRRLFFIGFGVLLLFLLISRLAWVPWGMFGGPNRDWVRGGWDHDKGAVTTTAAEVFETYRDNSRAWKTRFARRPLVVTGTVVRVVSGPGGDDPNILFQTPDPAKPLWVDLQRKSYDASAELKPGQSITVRCRYMQEHMGPDPWLRHCEIEEASALPALPSPPPVPPLPPVTEPANEP
jgi:hypothetical protein